MARFDGIIGWNIGDGGLAEKYLTAHWGIQERGRQRYGACAKRGGGMVMYTATWRRYERTREIIYLVTGKADRPHITMRCEM
jgi:hypothetical protein